MYDSEPHDHAMQTERFRVGEDITRRRLDVMPRTIAKHRLYYIAVRAAAQP